MWAPLIAALPTILIAFGVGLGAMAAVLAIKLFHMEEVVRTWASQIEGNVMLLFVGIVIFAIILIFVEYRFNNDSVVFQAMSSILSGFAGAFFGVMSVKKSDSKAVMPPVEPPAAPPEVSTS